MSPPSFLPSFRVVSGVTDQDHQHHLVLQVIIRASALRAVFWKTAAPPTPHPPPPDPPLPSTCHVQRFITNFIGALILASFRRFICRLARSEIAVAHVSDTHCMHVRSAGKAIRRANNKNARTLQIIYSFHAGLVRCNFVRRGRRYFSASQESAP